MLFRYLWLQTSWPHLALGEHGLLFSTLGQQFCPQGVAWWRVGRRHSGSCLPWELGWAATSGRLPSHLGFSWRPEPRGLAAPSPLPRGLSSLSGFAWCSSRAGRIRGGRNHKAPRGPGREVRQHRLSCLLLVRERRMSLDSCREETDSLPDGSSRRADGHGDGRGYWGAFVQALCCTLLLHVLAQPLSVGTGCCLGGPAAGPAHRLFRLLMFFGHLLCTLTSVRGSRWSFLPSIYSQMGTFTTYS